MSRITIEAIETKGIITNPRGKPDPWFQSSHGINPYQGCEHDCLYCDGKSDWYRMPSDFGTRVKYKANAPELLRAFFHKKGLVSSKTSKLTDFLPDSSLSSPIVRKFLLFIGGGVCDVYQPAEKQVKMTRRLLKLCLEYTCPVFILTKGASLLKRDLALLRKLNERAFVRVGFTVTLADSEVKRIFEPHSATTESRFQIMEELNELGIEAGGVMVPIIPFIGDTDENLEAIARRAKEAKAKFLIHGSMTLKPGHKEEFLKTIAQHYPDLLPPYELMYAKSFSPDPKIYKYPSLRAHEFCKTYGVSDWIPRYIPDGQIAENLLGAAHLWAIGMMYLWRGNRQTEVFTKAGGYVNSLERPWSSIKTARLQVPERIEETLREFKETGTSSIFESLF
ncbi:MAG: radical SAM protein [Candidatus Heimdallarchaeota archaeon]